MFDSCEGNKIWNNYNKFSTGGLSSDILRPNKLTINYAGIRIAVNSAPSKRVFMLHSFCILYQVRVVNLGGFLNYDRSINCS